MKFKCVNCNHVQSDDDGNRFCIVCGDNLRMIEEKVSVVPVEVGPVIEEVKPVIVVKKKRKSSKKKISKK